METVGIVSYRATVVLRHCHPMFSDPRLGFVPPILEVKL